MKTKLIIGFALAMGYTLNANAILLDVSGAGNFAAANVNLVEFDHFSDKTETGVSVGAVASNSVHNFSGQARVSSIDNGAIDTTPVGLNRAPTDPLNPVLSALGYVTPFEITKEYSFTDLLNTLTVNPDGSVTANFSHLANAGPNISIYLDPYSSASNSQAVPGVVAPGAAAGVFCYGTGACPAGSDGTLILQAQLISNTSSFTAAAGFPGLGNGSFDLGFQFTYINPSYISGVNVGEIFQERFTGTLTQPLDASQPIPVTMWDGTALFGADRNAFKVDSSESFFKVPEPSSIALLGLGLLGLVPAFKRRNHNVS